MASLNVKPSLREVERRYFKNSSSIMRRALKTTVNRGVGKLRQTMNVKFREQINVPAATMKTRLIVRKDLKNLRASVGVKNKPFDFLRFVKGRKKPRKQKGISVRRRRPLQYEIKKGVRRTGYGMFMANVNGGVRVFRRQQETRRKEGSELPISRQTVASPARFLLKSTPTRAQIIRDISAKLRKDLVTNIKFFASKL